MIWPDDYLIPGIEPFHQEEAGIIYCADCRDILPHLPKVDLVLTDSPYKQTACEWDKNITLLSQTAEDLCQKFGVSRQALEIRLKHIGITCKNSLYVNAEQRPKPF